MDDNFTKDDEVIEEKKNKGSKQPEAVPIIVSQNIEGARRYASANQVHYDSVESLKNIANRKINPDYAKANMKQQAGFSAEIKTAARKNAEKTINGDTITKTVRTDDMVKQADGKGNTIGGINEPLYDIADVDAKGNYILGSGRQLKYVGSTPDECTKKLLSKGYDKYRDADVTIEVPSDYYDEVQRNLADRAVRCRKNIARAEQNGNKELAAKHRAELDRIENTKVKRGKLTNDEALEARKHPVISTAKDAGKIAHRAGVEGAKFGGALAGTMSGVYNIKALIEGEKTLDEALIDTALDTGKGALTGYVVSGGTALAGNTIKNVLGKFSTQLAADASLPGKIITAVMITGKSLGKYLNGEISTSECLLEIGENGLNVATAGYGAMIGQTVIPIPIVGAAVGAAVATILTSSLYQNLINSLNDSQLEHEERMRIQAECKVAAEEARKFREELEKYLADYFQGFKDCFNEAFALLDEAFIAGDADGMIAGANMITRKLGGNVPYNNLVEARSFFIKN